ncbi:hypothetical protein TNCV_2973641 [Trichonephila clavipes]|nr:hypothetical protein TNCV_2973641 [Trichonephila clavipes]
MNGDKFKDMRTRGNSTEGEKGYQRCYSELDNRGLKLHFLDETPRILLLSATMKRTSGLNGYVNKQNCRIWSEANPQVYVETPLHPEKLTVWCALWAGGILLQKR